jgi:hypothetical protein
MEYDANTHILKEKAAATVDHFEPAIGGDDDFNL